MDPAREAFKAIDRAMTGDSRVLEVGCGSGEMAERINALPGVSLVATDDSDEAVEETAARGVDARHADICYLPFDGESFDVVYAGWMLDHVRDIDRALAEVRRVLRPGGTFVAVTDGDDGAAERRRHRFSSETGERMLSRRFSDVRRQDLETDTGDVTVFEAR
jgi:ubiquinone/menaquinone biosynthesis C-methylase UbiE